jgi:hypothetical protein
MMDDRIIFLLGIPVDGYNMDISVDWGLLVSLHDYDNSTHMTSMFPYLLMWSVALTDTHI